MDALHSSLALLFAELTDGPAPDAAYMLNSGDPGLLRSLDSLPAEAASKRSSAGTASIAAHVDHVCYGLDLMNRWSDGEPNPWSTADWTASWQRGTVTQAEWDALRERLRQRYTALARCARDAARAVPRGTERRHRQHCAPGVSPRRNQADRPLDSGSEGELTAAGMAAGA